MWVETFFCLKFGRHGLAGSREIPCMPDIPLSVRDHASCLTALKARIIAFCFRYRFLSLLTQVAGQMLWLATVAVLFAVLLVRLAWVLASIRKGRNTAKSSKAIE